MESGLLGELFQMELGGHLGSKAYACPHLKEKVSFKIYGTAKPQASWGTSCNSSISREMNFFLLLTNGLFA